MKKLKTIYPSRRLSSYLLVGVSAFASEYTSFIALAAIGVSLLISQSVSFMCGLLVSFLGNRTVTFKDKQSDYVLGGTSQLWRYGVLAFINLILSNLVLYTLVHALGVLPLIAKVVVMAMVTVWNYLVFSRLIFRTK